MKIKKLFGTAAITVGLAALAACNNGGATNAKTITFLTTAGDDLMEILNDAKVKYEENSEYTVQIINGYGYDTLKQKVNSDLAANSQPSLAVCYGDHVADYLTSNKVLDMNTFIENDDDFKTNILPQLNTKYYDEGTIFGDATKRYTMPLVKSTDAVYYNKDVVEPVLKKLNIDVNDPTQWTWTALWNVCEELKNDYPKSTPLGYDSEGNWVISYLEEQGALQGKKLYTDGSKEGEGKILFDNDTTKAFFKEVYGKYDEGLVTTKGAYGAYTSTLFSKYTKTSTKSDYDGSFISIGSTGGASHQLPKNEAFEVAVAPEPSLGTEATRKQISQGPSLVMFNQNDDAKAQATWDFVKVLLSKEVQMAYAKRSLGYSPVREDALDTLVKSLDPETAADRINKDCLELMENVSSSFYTSDCFSGSAVSRVQIGQALINLLKTSSTESLDSKVNSVIKAAADETKYNL